MEEPWRHHRGGVTEESWRNHRGGTMASGRHHGISLGLAAAKLQLPNQSSAAAKQFGSCQTRVWQLPNQSLAAAKPEFGSCQTRATLLS